MSPLPFSWSTAACSVAMQYNRTPSPPPQHQHRSISSLHLGKAHSPKPPAAKQTSSVVSPGGNAGWCPYSPLALTIPNPVCQGLCTEPSKHHSMHSPYSGTCQHAGHCQWARRHVDCHPVTSFHPLPFQGVAQAACQLQQLPAQRSNA